MENMTVQLQQNVGVRLYIICLKKEIAIAELNTIKINIYPTFTKG